MRAILLTLFFVAVLAIPGRADMPLIPNSARIITLEEVKNYWVNRLPVPTQPSRLMRDHHKLIVHYHKEIGERHRLVQAIRAGKHDEEAKIVMLEHNIYAYLLKHDDAKVAELTAELGKLQAVAKREREKRAEADRIERLDAGRRATA